jgi:uncharacterized repeat protein (TIGR03803 family)
MAKLNGWKTPSTLFLLWAATAIAAPAQRFRTLANFDGTNGADPASTALIQGLDGNFYGTAIYGGGRSCDDGYGSGCGTVFRVTRRGALTALHSFSIPDGAYPSALALATSGSFYGTASEGGTSAYCDINTAVGCGTVFKIDSTAGTLTKLYNFCAQPNCPDGSLPGGLMQAIDGSFYGTTTEGGANVGCTPESYSGCGTVFKITPNGELTTLYSFCAQTNCTDGAQPYTGLVQASDGNFYGTTFYGGNLDCQPSYGCGTVFRITPSGKLTTLHTFDFTDGAEPFGALIQATDGNLYGTTWGGGANPKSIAGTVFRITLTGTLTTLHSFDYQVDGDGPLGLTQATDGNFYGTTADGGGGGSCGTVFKITPEGVFTTVVLVDQGCSPSAGLLQATNGTFYGTTSNGGPSCIEPPYGCGTVFRLGMGLGPFVTFVRTAGKVGQTGPILGQGFTGTTSVLLNGTPATFTVVSDTYIRGTVPPGATSGYVTVTTPNGTLTSNVPFHVIP